MASTFTPRLGLEKPANNDLVDNWDAVVNANMDAIDAAIGRLPVLTSADPAAPESGDVWLRSDLGELRARIGSATYSLTMTAV